SFFFSSRRRHTRFSRDWSSDVCSSDLTDPTGLFESKSEAKSWPKENNIRTGWFSGNRVSKSGHGSWSVDNKRAGVSYSRADSGRSEERRVGKECRSRWWTYR